METVLTPPARKGHIVYFDYLESISIYFVTSLHFYTLHSNVTTTLVWFLYRTCIPLFFMVHGALLLGRDQTLSQIGKRVGRIALQLIGWNLVYLLLSLALGLLSWEQVTPELIYQVFFNTADSGGIPSYHLWFSYALISIYLVLPVVQLCRKHAPQLLYYLLGICFLFAIVRLFAYAYGTYFGQLWLGTPLTLDELCRQLNPFGQYSIHLFYFIGGWCLYDWLQRPHRQGRLILLSFLLFLLGEGLMLVEQYLAHGTLAFADGLPAEYQRIGLVCMSAGLFLFASQLKLDHCPLNGVAQVISRHTLDIYYLHIIFAKLISLPVSTYGWAGLTFNGLRALAVLLLSLLCGLLLQRIPLVRRLLA